MEENLNLVCKIPEEYCKSLQICQKDIWYSSRYDLTEQNEFFDRGYIIVTRDEIMVTEGKTVMIREQLKGIEDVRHQVLVGNGILILKKNGEEKVIARFSMKYLTAVSYLATGAKWLSEGYEEKVISSETERICSRCGRGLRTTHCLHCDGKWLSLIHI